MIGQILGGRYQIIQQLGKGGFGITFIAIDTARPGNPQCVVKQFKPMSNDPLTLEVGKILFEREAQKLETLGNHDQIPRLLGYFQQQQEFYLVQEYIEGHDLSQEIVSGTQLNETYVIKLLQDILEVLTVVHQQNLIHRDLKPSNIRRRKSDGKIVLIDFGAVKEVTTQVVNPEGQISHTSFIHTRGYAPSEQLQGQPTFSSDIYALGVICIYALTGINPSPNGLPTNHQTGEIAWRDAYDGRSDRTNLKISPKVANIIDKMVRYDYRQRYQSASETLEAMKALSPKTRPGKLWLGVGVIAIFAPLIIWLFYYLKHSQVSFLTYQNVEHNMQIKYPETWIKQEQGDFGEVARFLPKSLDKSSNCSLEMLIHINDLPQQLLSLNEYKNIAIQKIKSNNPGIAITENQNQGVTLANYNAYKLTYTRKEGECNLQIMEIGTVRNGKAYFITYTAESAKYSEYLPTAEAMIQSFQITEKN
jgi:eukaryotic-like serine/threonine-protein kinase